MKSKIIKYPHYNSQETKIFFTSDLHFGHQNIISMCHRPFKDVNDMDDCFIENWNSVVDKNDIVYNLGDFAYASQHRWAELINALNGEHHLILGNHDLSRFPGDYILSLFASVSQQEIINIDNRQIILNHYPMLCYAGTYRNYDSAVWQLFGHVHTHPESFGKDIPRLSTLFPFQYDVGVDNNNYTPVSYEQITKIIKEQFDKIYQETKE